MTVHFIGVGPGAPDLITLRGRDLIAASPVCLYAGSLIPKAMLDWCPSGARIIDTAPLDLDAIIAEIQSPMMLDRMWRACIRAISRSGVPAASRCAGLMRSAFPTASRRAFRPSQRRRRALKRELTLPGVAQSLVLTRTSGRASAMPARETLATFAESGATLAVHLSIHVIDQVVAELTPFYGADCPVAIVFRASWPDERILRGTLASIAAQVRESGVERTALILVGPALASEDFGESALYSAGYDRRFRPGGGT
jgi:precorrin-4/cobalt-precorrin-4 C11-methyltransferase